MAADCFLPAVCWPTKRDDFSLSASSVTGSCSVTLKDQTSPEAGGNDALSSLCYSRIPLSRGVGRRTPVRVLVLLLILISPDLWSVAVAFCADVAVMDPSVVNAEGHQPPASIITAFSFQCDLKSDSGTLAEQDHLWLSAFKLLFIPFLIFFIF